MEKNSRVDLFDSKEEIRILKEIGVPLEEIRILRGLKKGEYDAKSES